MSETPRQSKTVATERIRSIYQRGRRGSHSSTSLQASTPRKLSFDSQSSKAEDYLSFSSDEESISSMATNNNVSSNNVDSVKKSMNKTIQKFSGKREHFSQFISNIEEALSDLNTESNTPINQLKLIQFAHKHLIDPNCFAKVASIDFTDLPTFKKALIKNLFAGETSSVLTQKLKGLKQHPTEKAHDFIDRFKLCLITLESCVSNEVKNSEFFKDDVRRTFINSLYGTCRLLAIMKASEDLDTIFSHIRENEDVNITETIENKLDKILVLSEKRVQSDRKNVNYFNPNARFNYKNTYRKPQVTDNRLSVRPNRNINSNYNYNNNNRRYVRNNYQPTHNKTNYRNNSTQNYRRNNAHNYSVDPHTENFQVVVENEDNS
jgi:hypothetical protein